MGHIIGSHLAACQLLGETGDVFEHTVDPPSPLSTAWFRLEMLAPLHNERDFEAWMSSIEHIHATPGFASTDWGGDNWPMPMTSGRCDRAAGRAARSARSRVQSFVP
jgi:hypothetical protein